MFKRTRISHAALAVLGGGFVLAAAPVAAQTAPPGQSLERVEITGSSIKRIDAETALPVQVITREQIQRSGAVNVEQLMQTVSSISSSGGLTAASASGATTGGISAISLHGLTSLRTLVLLNGRRVAPYGTGFTGDSVSVDVNSIPLAAIDRVEVLKDGASAIYGSDAIAGVVNFILRQDFTGIEATGEYGHTTQGGGGFKRATGTFGIGNLAADRYNFMFVASYQKEAGILGGDRSFARSGINEVNLNDTSSGNTFPGNIATYNPVTGATGLVNRNPAAPGCPSPYAILDPLFPANRCRFDPSPLVTLVPESDRGSLFATGKFAITPDIVAYAEASYNRNKIRTVIQPVPLSDQFALPDNNPLCAQAPYNKTDSGPCQAAFVLNPGSPFYPTAYATAQYGSAVPLVVRYRSALTGNRDITDISEAPRAVLGVKGTVASWDFDVAGLYSESKVREQVNNGYPLYTLIMPLLNSGNVNPFGDNTSAVQAQADATQFRGDAFKVKSSLASLAGRVSGDVARLPAGPLGVALGAEGRKEKYQYEASNEIQTGDVSGYGGNFLPIDRSRNVTAVFGEVNVPIVKNLEGNVAVRYDHYSGVGNSTTPKGSLRWQPIPQLLLRTSYGRGFRAPSLQDLYAANTQGVTTSGVSDPLRCPTTQSSNDCLTQFAVTNGGNSGLKPEKSKNFTLGTVLEPINNVSVGIDYFNVKLTDTITNGVPVSSILADPAAFGALITRAPVDPATPTLPGRITNISQTNLNLGTTKVAGFDLDLRWRIPTTEYGRFQVSGSGTYFRKFDTSNLDGSFSGGIDQINTATGGVVPRLRTYLAVDWQQGPFSVTVANNWQKHYKDVPGTFEVLDPDSPDYTGPQVHTKVNSYVTWDLQGSYEATKNWRFTLGARNVFDRDPPYTNTGGQSSFQAGYDPQYGDPRGRFLYGRVTYLVQ